MVPRKPARMKARRSYTRGHEGSQREPDGRASPTRAQQKEPDEQEAARAGQEPRDPDRGLHRVRPHDSQSEARRQRRQRGLEDRSGTCMSTLVRRRIAIHQPGNIQLGGALVETVALVVNDLLIVGLMTTGHY